MMFSISVKKSLNSHFRTRLNVPCFGHCSRRLNFHLEWCELDRGLLRFITSHFFFACSDVHWRECTERRSANPLRCAQCQLLIFLSPHEVSLSHTRTPYLTLPASPHLTLASPHLSSLTSLCHTGTAAAPAPLYFPVISLPFVMDHSGMDMSEGAFCAGTGMVMLNGFQSTVGNTCVLFLFQGAAVDTATKYAFAILGVFVIAFLNEILRWTRAHLSLRTFGFSRTYSQNGIDISVSLLFAVQMILAYWIMLFIMLYEYVFFIAIIAGLGIGHYVTRILDRHYARTARSDSLGTGIISESSTSPCCGGDHTVSKI